MNVLEKILEEILQYRKDNNVLAGKQVMAIEEIIRSHMDDISREKDTKITRSSRDNDGWIPIEERLPEVEKVVKVTVHHSEWIGDYDSDWVKEEEKVYHPEKYYVHDGYLSRNGTWTFYDEEYMENTCEKEFGTDKGRIYSVVTAWRPIPEPYRPEKGKQL